MKEQIWITDLVKYHTLRCVKYENGYNTTDHTYAHRVLRKKLAPRMEVSLQVAHELEVEYHNMYLLFRI